MRCYYVEMYAIRFYTRAEPYVLCETLRGYEMLQIITIGKCISVYRSDDLIPTTRVLHPRSN